MLYYALPCFPFLTLQEMIHCQLDMDDVDLYIELYIQNFLRIIAENVLYKLIIFLNCLSKPSELILILSNLCTIQNKTFFIFSVVVYTHRHIAFSNSQIRKLSISMVMS